MLIGEQYEYHIDKMTFIVSPVYQTKTGETMAGILLKLMRADVDAVDILAAGNRQRYNKGRNTACLTAGRRSN